MEHFKGSRDEIEEHHWRQDDAELQQRLDADLRPMGSREDWNSVVVICPGCGRERPYKGLAYHLQDDDHLAGTELIAALERARGSAPYK
mgnify:CR=1 FL=1